MEISEFKNKIWDLTRMISENFINMFLPVVEQYGLTIMQLRLLTEVDQNGGHTIGSLGKSMRIAGGNISSMCKRLEHDGFLQRVRDRKDERIVRIDLTGKGRDTIVAVDALLIEKYAGLLANEDGEKLTETIASLEYLNELFCQMQIQSLQQTRS